MKPVLSLLGRYALTLCVVAVSAFIALKAWSHYERTPWTRDGRVGVDVVQIAPEVSGTVSAVPVVDNQYVRRGDVLYEIDPERLRFAVALAQADVEAKRQDMIVRQATARRQSQLKDVVSQEAVQQSGGAAAVARAAYQAAVAALDLANLNLARSTVRAPVDGYVTNLRLRPGDYATAGVTKVAVVDAASFWITGYFEETKIRQLRVGDPARIMLMGFDQPVSGHVDSTGRGIDNSNDAPGHLGLPSVAATFSWVRLAQRIPVRIHIDRVPTGVELAAGMTATVEITPAIGEPATGERP
ncbi:efflux RND transporter periplasmic adaptor subunit [Agrobacterium tumefaciens]|uniref:Efflux RND transporter periplasmic adaptor subunit n=1 Tax=Agrobacterium tumefaciens TaxID=358 RepID=A0AAP9E458_AGRTU|nr:efflux RND transporter periplasmic adaptor subunit [Agrobacterium tumefaciens]NSZ58422.1 efflux RND transporter periplasmic adaptor subunit [Agrobacterium tumefaciens]QDY94502.1 efflux RND transporter periplasmic adaptor subunit [Agrobacterium tumefaciens]UXS49625.1 efflux RND transporter periplasmic adaptor subunit [Agrobacterium tumefaciens]UXS70880.1 efflux RND transporter periplasmic adaptor subunit [Agrobacterium tumefaciens]UXS78543.1 efflux RND transporter periplasmic adaptor subunit